MCTHFLPVLEHVGSPGGSATFICIPIHFLPVLEHVEVPGKNADIRIIGGR